VGENRYIIHKRGKAIYKTQNYFIYLNLEQQLSVDEIFCELNKFVALNFLAIRTSNCTISFTHIIEEAGIFSLH